MTGPAGYPAGPSIFLGVLWRHRSVAMGCVFDYHPAGRGGIHPARRLGVTCVNCPHTATECGDTMREAAGEMVQPNTSMPCDFACVLMVSPYSPGGRDMCLP